MSRNDKAQTRKNYLADNDNKGDGQNGNRIFYKHSRIDHHAHRDKKYCAKEIFQRLHIFFNAVNQLRFGQDRPHKKRAQSRGKTGISRQQDHSETQADRNQKQHLVIEKPRDLIKKRRHQINTDDKTIKLIERLKNGNTQISITTKLEKTVTIRDKKGKIISEQRYNIFNPEPAKTAKQETPEGWRQKYLKLCSQNGVKPRICGVKCGAWEHFLELKLKYENPTAYEKYLELRSYRARYDKIARIMQALDEKKIDASLLKPAKEDNSLQGIINFLNQIDSAKNRC